MQNQTNFLRPYWYFCRDHFPLALLLHSFVFYFFCHFSAYFYFSNWEVNYFAFADTSTIISFALQKPFALFCATIFIPLCLFLIVVGLAEWINAPKNSYNMAHLYVTRARIITISLCIVVNAVSFAHMYAFDNSDIQKFKLGETNYYSVNYPVGTLTCVVPIGYLGDYIVFKKSDFSTIYIKRVDISNIIFNSSSNFHVCPLQ